MDGYNDILCKPYDNHKENTSRRHIKGIKTYQYKKRKWNTKEHGKRWQEGQKNKMENNKMALVSPPINNYFKKFPNWKI